MPDLEPVGRHYRKINQSEALELGKAAEHLVAADLILAGYRAFLSDQGLPYDVCVDLSNRIIRVQVKATKAPRNVNSQGRRERIAYSWSVRRRGKGGAGEKLSSKHCDIVALVALDIGAIAYLPIRECGVTVQLCQPGVYPSTKFKSAKQWGNAVDEFPFACALASDPIFYQSKKRAYETCVNGHDTRDPEAVVFRSGRLCCKICDQKNSLSSYQRRLSVVSP